MKRVVILGSTGSVGESAVSVAAALRDRIQVVGVVGKSKVGRLAEQAALLGCSFAATGDPARREIRVFRKSPDTGSIQNTAGNIIKNIRRNPPGSFCISADLCFHGVPR